MVLRRKGPYLSYIKKCVTLVQFLKIKKSFSSFPKTNAVSSLGLSSSQLTDIRT